MADLYPRDTTSANWATYVLLLITGMLGGWLIHQKAWVPFLVWAVFFGMYLWDTFFIHIFFPMEGMDEHSKFQMQVMEWFKRGRRDKASVAENRKIQSLENQLAQMKSDFARFQDTQDEKLFDED